MWPIQLCRANEISKSEFEINYYIMSPGKNDSQNLSAVTTDWEILNQNFAERSSMNLHSFPKYKKIIKII